MAIVDRTKLHERPIPGESDPDTGEGEFIKFAQMPWSELAEARRVRAEEQRREARDFGGDVLRELRNDDEDEEAIKKKAARDEYDPDNFDRLTVLKATIREWSYSETVSESQIKDLDEPTAAWAHKEAIEIARPPGKEEGKESSLGSGST